MDKMDYKQDLYMGTDIRINDYISIHQPTLRDIFNYNSGDDSFESGEYGYYKMLSIITATPADYDVQLDDAGIRYEDVDHLDFFFSLVRSYNMSPNITGMLFGDLDLTTFSRFVNPETESVIYQNDDGAKIDKALYTYIMTIIRDMHNITVNQTKWQNETSRQMHMDYERKRAKRKRHKKVEHVLLPIISMLVNDPGFKYNREQVLDLNIYFFYDCYKQRLHYQQVDHLMTGVYVGLIDTKKMDLSEALNMIRKDV